MRCRQLITAMTLIAFVPLSTGCSKSRTIGVCDEPTNSTSSSSSRFRNGEAVRISGYTRTDDGFREWDGHVRLAQSDSLEFEAAATNGEPVSQFVLQSSQVKSISAVETDKVAITILVTTSVLVVGGAIAAATFAATMGDFDMRR